MTPEENQNIESERKITSWKTKARKRREENECLKERFETMENRLIKLDGIINQANVYSNLLKLKVESLSEQLEKANRTIIKQQAEIIELKKKLHW